VNFDRVAPFYRTLEAIAFGNALQRARIRWLRAIPKPGRALILGEGNGRFVCELLKVYPGAQIDCVDASERMLELVKTRLNADAAGATDRVRFLHRDIREWAPGGSYDLIVTHFVLDCFEAGEMRRVVEKLGYAATSEATWLLADFTVPQTALARLHAKVWLRAMYSFFRLAAGLRTKELFDPTGELIIHGFVCQSREVSRFGMLKSEVWRC
jgi:ubiquinone/menaquinone biosynthesis C-methylase UbiE